MLSPATRRPSKVIPDTKIQFTPQVSFFETTDDWAVALQDIYSGDDAQERLDELAEANTEAVNKASA